MAKYYDIDTAVRINGALTINGDLSMQANTLTAGSVLSSGVISGNTLRGDGSGILNLSSSSMTDVLKLDGSREMTGGFVVNRTSQHIQLKEAGVTKWHIESVGNTFKVNEGGTTQRFGIASGGATTIGGSLTATSFSTTGTISGSTVNAGINLQEAGVNLSAKYEPKGTLHDDRYYTETEVDTKLGTKSNTGHAHSWTEITSKPTTFTPATHTHDDRYYTETEMDSKLLAKSDTTHTHDDRYYTETEMDNKLKDKMGYGDVLMNTNPFGGKQLFINSVNNAIFRAESRWVVTGAIYNADSTVATPLAESDFARIFNGSYEDGITIPAGKKLLVNINFNGGTYPGYPYGNLYLSHYYTSHSASAVLRTYSTYEPHGIGWHEYAFADYLKNGSNMISMARNPVYSITQMEFEVIAPAENAAQVTQIDWQLDRPGNNEMPVVDKYRANNMYSDLTFKDILGSSNAVIRSNGSADFKGLMIDGNITVNGTVDGIDIADHAGGTGVGKHIPIGGTASQFLRGDGTWATISDENNYVSSVTAPDGGKGIITLNRNGLSALSVDLTHNHDDRYYAIADMDAKLGLKANATHTHDDRYYTESEIDTQIGTLNSAISGKASATHSHAWTEITGKPTTFTPSTHTHDDRYYTESEMDTKLSAKSDTTHSHDYQQHKLTNGNNAITAVTDWNNHSDTGFYMASGLLNQTSGSSWRYTQAVRHNANYALQVMNDFGGDTMGFRAKYADVWKPWRMLWHDGNFNPANYFRSDLANQTAESGMTVKGSLFLGISGTAGSMYLKNASNTNVIQLAGDGSAKSASVKAYINASGDAAFDGTLTVNTLSVTGRNQITNLNAEMVGGITAADLGRRQTAYEIAGNGVHSGLSVVQSGVAGQQTQFTVNAGIAYTASGERVDITATSRTIAAPSATTNANRFDAVYIAGPSEGNNDGEIRTVQGAYSSTPVAPAIPADGILLAHIYMGSNQGTITDDKITDKRDWMQLRYADGQLRTDASVNIGKSLTTDAPSITVDKPLKISGANTTLTFTEGQTSKTFTHNLGLANYTVMFSTNSPEPHVYWTSKTANTVTVNLDDVCEGTVSVDVSITAY